MCSLLSLDGRDDKTPGTVKPQAGRGLCHGVTERGAACCTDRYVTEEGTSALIGPCPFFSPFVTESLSSKGDRDLRGTGYAKTQQSAAQAPEPPAYHIHMLRGTFWRQKLNAKSR